MKFKHPEDYFVRFVQDNQDQLTETEIRVGTLY